MRTEQIIPAEIQAQIDLINAQELILAEVPLDDITIDGVEHSQILRVKDVNIALSIEYLKVSPKRILINKISGDEMDLNLPVPNWERLGHDMAALIDVTTGQRVLVPTKCFEDVQVEITPAITDEETGEVITPATYEMQEQEIETKQAPVLVPVLKYLMLIISMKKFKEAFEIFTHQYVNDIKAENPDYFKKLK